MVRKSMMPPAPANMAPVRKVFLVRKNVLTDQSVIWEVCLCDADGYTRIASAATEEQANTLCDSLNVTLHNWELVGTGNTVDA